MAIPTAETVKLTDDQRREYVERAETRCPRCDSEDFCGGSFDGEGTRAWQTFICHRCDLCWTEVYQLTTVETEADD